MDLVVWHAFKQNSHQTAHVIDPKRTMLDPENSEYGHQYLTFPQTYNNASFDI